MNKKVLFGFQLSFAIFLLSSTSILAAPIYRWVDKSGIRNFSNFPSSVPKSVFEDGSVKASNRYVSSLSLVEKPEVTAQDKADKEYEAEIKKHLERQLLVNKYKELVNREGYLQEQLTITKDSALKTKREFETLVIKGYFSDHSILELKRLQREMRQIKSELRTIEPKKRKIVAHAGKRGISDSYFFK